MGNAEKKEGLTMKATIDRSGCISCGICADTCPQVFEMDDDGLAKTVKDEVPDTLIESAKEARDQCPVSVINIE